MSTYLKKKSAISSALMSVRLSLNLLYKYLSRIQYTYAKSTSLLDSDEIVIKTSVTDKINLGIRIESQFY